MATLTFYGAVTGVTGSMHLLETQSGRVLLDCGLYQGGREEEAHNEDPFQYSRLMLWCCLMLIWIILADCRF